MTSNTKSIWHLRLPTSVALIFILSMSLGQAELSISGHVYEDNDSNGAMTSGDQGLQGWEISIILPAGSIKSTTTDKDGIYKFCNISAGRYRIRASPPGGWKAIGPNDAMRSINMTVSPIIADFGFIAEGTRRNETGEPQNSINNPPVLIDLIYKKNLQSIYNTSFKWTAVAEDQENDQLFYRFLVDLNAATPWTTSSSFITNTPISEMTVWVRDGKHMGDKDFDSSISIAKVNESTLLVEEDNSLPSNTELTPYPSYINFTEEIEYMPIEGESAYAWSKFSQSSSQQAQNLSIHSGLVIAQVLKEPKDSPARNLPPEIITLNPDLTSPQEVGAVVIWKANAIDPENDPIYYEFLLNGPGTRGTWKVVQDWSTNNIWTWNVKDDDVGSSDVSVLIRDAKHADASNMDDFKNSSGYEINAKQLASIDVQVMNDLYTEKDRNVYFCQEGKYLSYRNRLYLTGPDLDKVAKVKYVLPPSFPNPELVSQDASNNFETWILTWGRFNNIAIVTIKSGQQFQIPYILSFKDKVEAAKSQGIPMVENCEG